MPTNYDYGFTQAICNARNLKFSPELALFADPRFKKAEFTQMQVNAATSIWCECVATTMNPARYSWLGRLKIALYFLGFFKKHRPR